MLIRISDLRGVSNKSDAIFVLRRATDIFYLVSIYFAVSLRIVIWEIQLDPIRYNRI